MTRRDSIIAAAAILVAAGTGAAQPVPAPAPVEEEAPPCPDFIRGARMEVTDIDGGIAFTITTKDQAYAAPLRETLRQLADFLEQHTVVGVQGAPTQLDIPPLDIGVRDIVSGAHVTVTAQRTEDIARLRTQAKQVEELWQSSTCINGARAKRIGISL